MRMHRCLLAVFRLVPMVALLSHFGCVTSEIESRPSSNPKDIGTTMPVENTETPAYTIQKRASKNDVRTGPWRTIRFVHYACPAQPEAKTSGSFDQPQIEFGVAHAFGDDSVQPFAGYRCD